MSDTAYETEMRRRLIDNGLEAVFDWFKPPEYTHDAAASIFVNCVMFLAGDNNPFKERQVPSYEVFAWCIERVKKCAPRYAVDD